MKKISIDLIKKLREKTSASVMDCRRVLEETDGDIDKAISLLRKQGIASADKKKDRVAGEGRIVAYIHHTGRVGAMVELASETDFVGRHEKFSALATEIAMQVASMNPEDIDELEKQEYIRDPGKTIGDLVKEHIASFGENIVIKRFVRYELGSM